MFLLNLGEGFLLSFFLVYTCSFTNLVLFEFLCPAGTSLQALSSYNLPSCSVSITNHLLDSHTDVAYKTRNPHCAEMMDSHL